MPKTKKNFIQLEFIYAVAANNWWFMKKFIEFVEEKDTNDVKKDSATADRFKNDYEYRKDILRRMAHLDPEDRNGIKHKLIKMFSAMIDDVKTFPECIRFILDTSKKKTSTDIADSIVQDVEDFFKNPKGKGLGYISGQNDVINSPNAAGKTNNSNYQ